MGKLEVGMLYSIWSLKVFASPPFSVWLERACGLVFLFIGKCCGRRHSDFIAPSPLLAWCSGFPREREASSFLQRLIDGEVEAGLGEQGVVGQRGAHKAQGNFLSCERISTRIIQP